MDLIIATNTASRPLRKGGNNPFVYLSKGDHVRYMKAAENDQIVVKTNNNIDVIIPVESAKLFEKFDMNRVNWSD